MNPLKMLHEHGQSFWVDYIDRDLVTGGGLKRLIEEDGLRGLTSNPTIFENAIRGSSDYDEGLRAYLTKHPDADIKALFEAMAIEDIRAAADALRPVYDASDGADGFVSLEVSPHLAHDAPETVAEGRRLWQAVDRPNLMIKVPATPEGFPAIEALIGEGINVNATLLFSTAHYEAAAQAYLRGVEKHPDPGHVASVASFFVSRVDTKVDAALEALGTPEALALRGKAAVANAKRAYARFGEIAAGAQFQAQHARGARPQRVLWGSTSTKNPAYRDVLYVEELIGPETVNTMPPVTVDAFRDHGQVRSTLLEGREEAEEVLERIARLGVDLDAALEELQVEGVAAFAASYDQLLAALRAKVEDAHLASTG